MLRRVKCSRADVQLIYNKSLTARYKPLILPAPPPTTLDTPSPHPEHSWPCPAAGEKWLVGGRELGSWLRPSLG
jgi:hypothetical protein